MAKKKNELQDTGLSSKYQTRTQRIIEQDGKFNVHKTGISRIESFNLYHYLVNISWLKFSLHALLFYVVINILFSTAYIIAGVEHLGIETDKGTLHGFLNAFFFSAQTLTTVGFGRINPQNISTNIIATFEAGIGLMVFAIATGLLYGRFSRPVTKIIFSKNAIVTKWADGLQAFQFRLVNAYNTEMMDAEVKVIASWLEQEDGADKRKFFTLKLEYEKIVFFPTMWTVNHIIDEESPLFGKTKEELDISEAEFLILFKAYDDTFTQIVNSRFSYRHTEVIWSVKYVRGILIGENGRLIVDINKLNEFENTDV
jgi:inward rectifier potassium channel